MQAAMLFHSGITEQPTHEWFAACEFKRCWWLEPVLVNGAKLGSTSWPVVMNLKSVFFLYSSVVWMFSCCVSCVPVPVPQSSCVPCVPALFSITPGLFSLLFFCFFFLGLFSACFLLFECRIADCLTLDISASVSTFGPFVDALWHTWYCFLEISILNYISITEVIVKGGIYITTLSWERFVMIVLPINIH